MTLTHSGAPRGAVVVTGASSGIGRITTAMPKKLLRDTDTYAPPYPSRDKDATGRPSKPTCERSLRREGGRDPPEVVARAVFNALTAKTPRTRYPAGAHARRIMALCRLLPDRMILRDLRLPRTSGVHTEAPIQHTERSSKWSQRFLRS